MSNTEVHKLLLDKNIAELCRDMEPEMVANEMLKGGETMKNADIKIFTMSNYEEVLHPPTRLEKNEKLVDLLQRKELNSLTEFLRSLTSIDSKHRKLAEKIQPVKYRVLWLATSPEQAASVVCVLEKSANASFSKMERIGKDKMLILRRARVFRTEYEKSKIEGIDLAKAMERCHEVEVCLVFPRIFPGSSQDIAGVFETIFKENLFPDLKLVVLGKLCDLEQTGENSFVVSNVVTIDRGKTLQAKPALNDKELSSIRELSRVKVGVMQGKPYRMSVESESSAGDPEAVVLDLDSVVLNFYAMCMHYSPEAQSLACITPSPTSLDGPSELDRQTKNSRALMKIVECLYVLKKESIV